jgi:Protein of unknown function (DUF3047)
MRRLSVTTTAFVLLSIASAPAAVAQTAEIKDADAIPVFSAAKPGAPQPPWEIVKVNERKKLTAFDLVENDGKVVLHAKSEAGSSGIGVRTSIDLAKTPMLSWRWKVAGLIDGADNSVAGKEDSPARISLTFDGDKGKLSFSDRTTMSLASSVYGRDLPYATLMYIWSNEAPVGTVISNPHTRRIQMIVVSSGKGGVGQWQTLKRNVREDYKKAFGEDPSPLKSLTAFTDADNTGLSAEAWYGDMVLSDK